MLDLNPSVPSGLAVSSPGQGRRNLALIFSAAVHVVAVVILCWRPAIFVKPQLIARGEGGAATSMSTTLYLPQDLTEVPQQSLSSLPAPVQKPRKTKLKKRSNVLEKEATTNSVEAGSRDGSALDGLAEGEDVMPAIPLPGSFADPKVSRWELPGGMQGDVIVEITIDDQGAVVNERLLQGMGHGIDEKVIAALRDWRFRPATRNGIAIPSKHDVHFHFPS